MHYYFIEFLRFVATVLITNSHYNNIWPIAALATGGSLGNTLFFAISGFCLSTPSDGKKIQWIKRRILRIYPPVIIVTLIVFVLWKHEISSFESFITYFIYPTQFWFASAIIIFYIVFFFASGKNDKVIDILMLCAVILYALIYVFVLDTSEWIIEGYSAFKWIYYFIVMMFAYKIRKANLLNKIKIPEILLGASFVIYFGIKMIFKIVPALMPAQFILHIVSFLFMLGCFGVGGKYEKKFQALMSSKIIGTCLGGIGAMSFEIYLVQTFVLDELSFIVFPLNFIVVTSLIIILGLMLHMLCKLILKVFK